MKFRGKLSRWNDDKGFGFITPINGGSDIFVHISAFKKSGHRRPSIGDLITFEVHSDNGGKKRAVNAAVEGVPHQRLMEKRSPNRKENKKGGVGVKILAFSGLVIVGVVTYMQFGHQADSMPLNVENTAFGQLIKKTQVNSFSCQGKTYCSEMNSCDEAKYYIKHCPDTKMDGDHDGIPCESQWCNW